MKTLLLLVLSLSLVFSIAYAHPGKSPSCEMVAAALSEVETFKPGITRAEIEGFFELDGGISSPQQATYVYKECQYLKIDVEFRLVNKNNKVEFSPTDVLVRSSKLYVSHPVKD
ncbi:MAG TPA: hypothetical protein VN577_14160 [Terriglobales bacterium]|nr:hypothetical protein [Terriglobales bacterium]